MPALVAICDNGVAKPSARTGEANQAAAFSSVPKTSRASLATASGTEDLGAAFKVITIPYSSYYVFRRRNDG